MRRRKEGSLEIVKQHQSKYGTTKSSKAIDTRSRAVSSSSGEMYGIQHYLTEKPSSEDDNNTQMHTRWLKCQIKSRKESDNDKIDKLMGLYKRREMLVSEDATTKDILEKYPWLQANPKQILVEMQRISNIDIEKSMTEVIDTYGKSILRYCHKKTRFYIICRTASAEKHSIQQIRSILPGTGWRVKDVQRGHGPGPCRTIGPTSAVIPEPAVSPLFVVYEGSPLTFTDSTTMHLYIDGSKT